jgi:hypothetical protein
VTADAGPDAALLGAPTDPQDRDDALMPTRHAQPKKHDMPQFPASDDLEAVGNTNWGPSCLSMFIHIATKFEIRHGRALEFATPTTRQYDGLRLFTVIHATWSWLRLCH